MAPAYVTGLHQLLRATSKAMDDTAGNIRDGLEKGGHVVLRKAQKYVPKDLGPLEASGKVTVTGVGMATKVLVEYGGEDAPYALYVHEDLTKAHAEPTCAKFLERAARETRGTVTSIVKRQVGQGTRRFKDGVEVE